MASLRAIFLAGPTASGKSTVALELAQRLNGEIISVDSMQVYRGLDIGTAKPSAAERARAPHHLIDVVDVSQPFDAAQFVSLARQAFEQIQNRGRPAIFSGGTGLYFQAYLKGLGQAPPPDAKLRAELEAEPLTDLRAELEARDPATFQRIDLDNRRRLVRALEVIRLTNRPFSEQRSDWSEQASPLETISDSGAPAFFGLKRSREDLARRIAERVDSMFEHGLVSETEALLPKGLAENKTALQALGYRQVVEYLRGVRSLDETMALVKLRTRQFAKRQLTWFQRQSELEWIDIRPSDSPARIADEIENRLDNARAGRARLQCTTI